MRVAILHDYINQYGGAERVLEDLLRVFPNADVYTLMYDKEKMNGLFANVIQKTSFLDNALIRNNHHFFIPFMPTAAQSIKINGEYDLVVSATAGYAKGMRVPSSAFHLMYCHSPLRYAWELDSYFKNPLFKTVFRPTFMYLKRWDYKTAQIPDAILTNANYIVRKIELYYHRKANVVYPAVNEKSFFYEPHIDQQSFYLAVGRLLHYKKIEFLIHCFKNTDQKLKIVGTGPYEAYLTKYAKAHPNIQFLGRVSDNELRKLYNQTQAFLFPQIEDFGLVAAEAQSCGAPIIAFAKGGSLEIVSEGKTGAFFNIYTKQAFWDAVVRVQSLIKSREAISKEAKRFSFSTFQQGVIDALPEKLRAEYRSIA
jgi:glycosyltransferase involved in cell wall biosynthesis